MRISSDIENAIFDWVYSVHPTKVIIWDKQDVERPTTDYILLNIITAGNMEGRLSYLGVKAGKAVYESFEKLTVSINVFQQENYLDTMLKLQRSVETHTTKLLLKKLGLTIRTSSPILDLTQMIETGFEYRCQSDFIVAYTAKTEVIAEPIKRIKGEIMGIQMDVTKP
jgi:hypothetical protein